MPAVKIGASRQIAIPKTLYDQLKLEPGDYLEVELQGDQLILTPKELVDKRLAEGLADIKKGRVVGPFTSSKDAMRTLRAKK
jgi:AbrB family looped-hinge helix DNA binding protein